MKHATQRKANTDKDKKDRQERAAARSMWKGFITFGLVSIPVRLYDAIHEKGIRYHLFSQKEQCRVRQQLVCQGSNKIISRDDLVKGYEISPEKFVIVTNKELDQIAPKSSHVIEIMQFVDLTEIDSLYFSKPYYLLPEPSGLKAYSLFVSALEKAGKVGLAKFTFHQHEYLTALRIVNHVVCLETMHFADEIRTEKDLPQNDAQVDLSDKEVKMAEQIIESMTAKFEPNKFHDEYRERVLELLEQKKQGKSIIETPAAPVPEAADLVSALEASLKQVKKRSRLIASS